ncbi:hypothetical protein [Blastopirellula retiformator]|uniref:Uncharacterized protein n=1 Tax=Blastopirellula retiformator TaxID=2527970 RepID=A0A5C5VML3_9BACT|nr:hypothetical protein [Blastopirellula retiformator]TWT39297.1 hypothetical protein Enr8_09950 [Blastopirellula retiformator]
MASHLHERLRDSNPGWAEWHALLQLVESLTFQQINDEYLGTFFAAGDRLCFSALDADRSFPAFVPAYVASLYGLKADEYEMAGGYAIELSHEPAIRGSLFSPLGNDADLGYPEIDPPPGTFPFLTTNTGASLFLTSNLQVVFPDAEKETFATLDDLKTFTRRSIQAAVENRNWTSFYEQQLGNLID